MSRRASCAFSFSTSRHILTYFDSSNFMKYVNTFFKIMLNCDCLGYYPYRNITNK
ncbi:hypothetical protein D3OALGB2SA_3439 [Olavius algarvensis associated proteobacterium Delta 3]|nr:hypothetical protein D3OALGB2SA_3439 [Olavius algarvensis associated proteobacterium Delta 3]